jgi:hypothetical protein
VSGLTSVLTDINRYCFKPSAAVRFIANDPKTRGTWRNPVETKPKQGWLVVFSWNQNGHPDHIGLVEQLAPTSLRTVEFNTSEENESNGGTVAQRIRQLKYVLGYVATY